MIREFWRLGTMHRTCGFLYQETFEPVVSGAIFIRSFKKNVWTKNTGTWNFRELLDLYEYRGHDTNTNQKNNAMFWKQITHNCHTCCIVWFLQYGCFQKLGKHPKMDGENNGKPYFLMDDLGGKRTTIFGNIYIGPIQWPLMYTYSFDPKKIQKVAFLIISAKADAPILPFLSTALIWTPAVQDTWVLQTSAGCKYHIKLICNLHGYTCCLQHTPSR